MKKFFLTAVAVLIIAIGLVAFSTSTNVTSNKKSIQRAQTGNFKPKVKVRLRWHGIGGPGNNCWKTNRECGDCPGVCVLIEWLQASNLTQEEKDDGFDYAYIELDKESIEPKLTFEPEASMDDGSGVVKIENDSNIGSYASNLLAENSVIIKAGEYRIDYTKGVGFGQVIFDVQKQ